MATVEAAIALGALVLVFAVVLGGLGAVVARIRCVDTAGEAARRAARDDVAGARDLAGALPSGAEVTVTLEGDTVVARVGMPPLGGALRGLRVTAEAFAAREPSVAAPTAAPDGGAGDGAAVDQAADGGVDADPGGGPSGLPPNGAGAAPGRPSMPPGAPEELPP